VPSCVTSRQGFTDLWTK